MAIRLLVALIALGLLHVPPQLARWRGDGLFRRWVAQLATPAAPGACCSRCCCRWPLCLLLSWLLARTPPGESAATAVRAGGAAVLLRPARVRGRPGGHPARARYPRRESGGAGAGRRWHARSRGTRPNWARPSPTPPCVGASAVLLWFFLLGPAGALLYRLAQTLGRDDSLPLDAGSRTRRALRGQRAGLAARAVAGLHPGRGRPLGGGDQRVAALAPAGRRRPAGTRSEPGLSRRRGAGRRADGDRGRRRLRRGAQRPAGWSWCACAARCCARCWRG